MGDWSTKELETVKALIEEQEFSNWDEQAKYLAERLSERKELLPREQEQFAYVNEKRDFFAGILRKLEKMIQEVKNG